MDILCYSTAQTYT